MELLSPRQQLRLAAETDVLIGVQGNGLSHLLWQKRGSAVFEIFPHVSAAARRSSFAASDRARSARASPYQRPSHRCSPQFNHDGVEGTGWTNDWPMLTRLKGSVYRAVDSLKGRANPVVHNIADLAHQLHVGNLVLNMTAIAAELDETVAKWRWVRDELAAGRGVDMTKHWNPHLVTA